MGSERKLESDVAELHGDALVRWGADRAGDRRVRFWWVACVLGFGSALSQNGSNRSAWLPVVTPRVLQGVADPPSSRHSSQGP